MGVAAQRVKNTLPRGTPRPSFDERCALVLRGVNTVKISGQHHAGVYSVLFVFPAGHACSVGAIERDRNARRDGMAAEDP
jgi:hypothetical protein